MIAELNKNCNLTNKNTDECEKLRKEIKEHA